MQRARFALVLLPLLAWLGAARAPAHVGTHPTNLDVKEDAILQLAWFRLIGGGVQPEPAQNPLEPQEYTLINSSAPGEIPMAIVRISWGLWSGHDGSYADYTATIRTGARTESCPGNEIPSQVTINPLLDGWRGTLEVELNHRFCDLTYKAQAQWNLSPPRCSPCKTLTCRSRAEIGSVEVDVPVGPAWYGNETIALSYRSETIDNAGTASLAVSGRIGDQGAEIGKPDGLIEWVAGGGQLARVFATPTSNDPEAFEIRVSSDPVLPEQTVYRVTRIENPEPPGGPRSLLVTETILGHTTTRTFTNPAAGIWVLVENQLRRTTRTTTTNETGTERVRLHRIEERDSSGEWQTVSVREELDTLFSWGWETTREIVDPDGRALTKTRDFYRDDEVTGPDDSVSGRGQLSRVEFPTGLVRSFEYHDSDPLEPSFERLTVIREHFAGSAGARETRRHVTRSNDRLDERIESLVDGILVSRTDIEARSVGSTHWRTVSRHDGRSATPLVTRHEYDSRPTTPLARRTIFPDGSVEELHETFTGEQVTRTLFTGVPNPASSDLPVLTGEEFQTISDRRGQLVQWRKRAIRNGTAEPLVEAVAVSHDTLMRPTAFDTYHGGRADPTYREEIAYGCCGISSLLGADGLRSHRFHDGLGRVFKTHRNGITRETVFDGLATRHHRYPEAVPNALPHAAESNRVSSELRDLAGFTTSIETLSPADASWVTTGITTEFRPAAGIGRRQTTTLPAVADDLGVPATIVMDWFTDGSPASVSGSMLPRRQLQHNAASGGLELTESLLAGNGSPREATTTSFDWLGRPLAVVFSGDADENDQADQQTFEYDPAGKLWRTTDPDGVTTLLEYDLLEESVTAAIDLDHDGVIDPASDHVGFRRHGLGQDDSGDTTRWFEQGVIAPDGTREVQTRSEVSGDGLAEWFDRSPASGAAPVMMLSTPVTGSPGSWDHSLRRPDLTSSVLRVRAGLPAELENFDTTGQSLNKVQYQFDPWQRLSRVSDPAGPDLENHYLAPLVDVVSRRRAAGGFTDHAYDHRGRPVEIDRPDTVAADASTVGNRRISSYWPHGGLRSVTGNPGTTLSFTWDHAHRLESLTTAGEETPTTRWFRDPDRGWLSAKRHPGQTLGSPAGPNFTYTAAGRPKTRTDARGVVTTWNYDNGGRIQSISYSDGTPSVTITARDHHGRPTGIIDAAGSSMIHYSATGHVISVAYQPGHLMAGWSAGSPRDALDRLSGLQISHNGETRQQLFYLYDGSGRLATVESPRIGARYDYLPGTRLVRQLAVSDPLGPVAYDTRSYDQDHRLDRRIVHNGSLGGGFHAFADYKFERDPLGRIESATIGDGTGWDYRYHPSGALAEADRSREGAVLPGHRFRWSYDARGNLSASSRRDAPLSPATFQANQLDQFTAIHRPGQYSIFGEAPLAAQVVVNGETALRDGPFFHHCITTPDPAKPTAASILVQSGSDSGSGSLHLPPAQFSPSPDANGNLRGDGIHDFTWDAENRLQQAETTPAAIAAGIPYARIRYTYDHQSRLLARERFHSPAATTPVESTRFLHAGWRCLGEIDAAGQLVRSLAWGLNRSSDLHLGDPNSALLWLHDHRTDSRLVTHCDPQGHIAGLIDSHSRQSVAGYLHGPFGESLAAAGPAANANPWRFSSHFTDPDTSLTHFGFRWFHPDHQRWLSRDPLGEAASPNLYAFLANDPVNQYDLLGGIASNNLLSRTGTFLKNHAETAAATVGGLIGGIATIGSAPISTADEAAAAAAEWGLSWESGGTLAGAGAGAVTDPLLLKTEECIENKAARHTFKKHHQEDLYSKHQYTTEDYIDRSIQGALAGAMGGLIASGGRPVRETLKQVKSPRLRARRPSTRTPEITRVIGRTSDLTRPGVVRQGEQLLDFHVVRKPDKTLDVRATWSKNHRALRTAMRNGRPIRDVSPGNELGQFLNGERMQLEERGWTPTIINGDSWWVPPPM